MKENSLRYDDFFARDIYSKWSEYCKKSAKSIYVISPYVDNTVKNLLSSKTISTTVVKKIYTRIDSDTIFDKPYQIRALINCLKLGIKIFHIPDLHSKALITDDKYISIGSQNFTFRGRKNKESSMLSNLDLSDSKFFTEINSWLKDALPIDLDYLLKLESELKKFRKKISSLRNEHQIEFDNISNEEKERKNKKLRKNLLDLKSKSKTQFESEYIYLTKTDIDNWDSSITTYLADPESDLRMWKNAGEIDSASLIRLKYYPCVQTSNHSISFVRLTKTRISFHLTQISLGYWYIEDKYYYLSINCPQNDTTSVNFQIRLDSFNEIQNKLNFYFDGSDFKYVSGKFSNKSEKRLITTHLLNKKLKQRELIQKCFNGHNLETIGQPITEFFGGWWYKLYIVDYFENPILVAEQMN